MTFEFQKPHHRRLIGATAVVTALAAAGLGATGSAGAASTPVLESLSYTQTGPGGGLYHPVGVSAYNGTVYVSNSGANVVIKRIAGTGIAGLGYAGPRGFPASLSSRDHPQNVAVNAAGDVYIADTCNNRVLKVTPSGKVTAAAGDGTAGYSGDGRLGTFAELNEPTGVAVDAQGNLYIADSANNVIRRVDAKTGIINTVAGDYAADQANDGLGGFSGDGGPAISAELNDPQGVAIDGAGDLYIADTNNSRIAEVTDLAQPGNAAGPVAPARS